MLFGEHAKAARKAIKAAGLSLALIAAPQAALAAAPAATAPVEQAADTAAPAADAAAPAAEAASTYVRMKPTEGKGMPVDSGIGLQDQYSDLGNYGQWIHDAVLLPLIAVISLFVLFLLLFVMARYNRRSNPTASKTSHNTVIEVVWTLVPVLILVGIAVPSIDLLAKQFKPAPANALTVKITGNQWFWTYSYPDNGDFEVNSYMLNIPGAPTINNGVREVGTDPSDGPSHLEVDNRMVVPVGEDIRLQITAADVIHSFAVPSLWFKLDAVPGRINEKTLHIREPGVYYGQCSELCGVKHGYMPIAIEALPREEYNAWVLAQAGGVIDGQKPAAEAPAEGEAAEAADEAAPAAAESPAPAA
ncbi:MAG: cytochrome c oxidase subunit II [Novosphingobium sp.]|nr:cytochrome c oxidase subunit II [Novosphingobium sp.]